MSSSLTKDQILKDIESLYQLAFYSGKLQVALRAKELQGRAIGLFKPQHLPDSLCIADMTEEQLGEFIALLEKHHPELKNLERPEIETSGKGAHLS